MSAPESNLDSDTRRQVIEAVAETLDHYYVFPEKGQVMREGLHASLSSGAYDALTTNQALCDRLTADLQAISSDKHIRVRYNDEPRPVVPPEEEVPANLPEWIAEARSVNFGFYKVERLPGNVGYLDLRNFWVASFPGAGETAVAAMNLLAYTDALIIDLRRNGGGAPSMITLLTSYLFEGEPVHLNTFYDRADNKTRQTWTLPYV